jgi:hypothetical protein
MRSAATVAVSGRGIFLHLFLMLMAGGGRRLRRRPESERIMGLEILWSYEHLKFDVLISYPEGEDSSGTQKRHVARRNKSDT